MDLYFLGYRKLDYTKEDGRHVSGFSCWFAASGGEYVGLEPFEVFVSGSTGLGSKVPGLKPLSMYKARAGLSRGKLVITDLA